MTRPSNAAAATLTVTEQDANHRTYVLDCPHARTTIDYLAPPVGGTVDERELVFVAIRERHQATCGCGWRIRDEVTE